MMSTWNDEATQREAMAAGADGFVSKFEIRERLLAEIARLRGTGGERGGLDP